MAAAECSASMRAIVEAMVALRDALPPASVIVSASDVAIHADADEGVEACAGLLGVQVEIVTFEGKRWLRCSTEIGSTLVTVGGPHRRVPPAVLDEQAVAAAVDQANAAIAGASS